MAYLYTILEIFVLHLVNMAYLYTILEIFVLHLVKMKKLLSQKLKS